MKKAGRRRWYGGGGKMNVDRVGVGRWRRGGGKCGLDTFSEGGGGLGRGADSCVVKVR